MGPIFFFLKKEQKGKKKDLKSRISIPKGEPIFLSFFLFLLSHHRALQLQLYISLCTILFTSHAAH
jgi:hypothetical protein